LEFTPFLLQAKNKIIFWRWLNKLRIYRISRFKKTLRNRTSKYVVFLKLP
jgi:hypothetical protein